LQARAWALRLVNESSDSVRPQLFNGVARRAPSRLSVNFALPQPAFSASGSMAAWRVSKAAAPGYPPIDFASARNSRACRIVNLS